MPTPTKPKTKPTLLRWSEQVASSDVQDPLGLSLRGSTRLGSLLLHCITSITPRARYFSFIPWCFLDYQSREKGKPHALAVKDAVVLRENALSLACAKNHEKDKGGTCAGGAVVGTNEAKRWLRQGNTEADLKKIKLAKLPALKLYFTSLVNLGCFVTGREVPEGEGEGEEVQFTWEEVELSPLGLQLAKGYDAAVENLPAVRALGPGKRRCAVDVLADLGRHGGLCELAGPGAPERTLLRDIFFALAGLKTGSHPVRRQSLLLVLDLCRQFSAGDWYLDESNFSSAVYFGEVRDGDDRLAVELPPALADVATRWRMFYFHHYMSVALEGTFSWLVTNLAAHGLAGSSLGRLIAGLDGADVRKALSGLFGFKLPKPFGEMTPSQFFGLCGLSGDLGADLSAALDHALRSRHPVAEDTLEGHVREAKFAESPTGLALPVILLATTLARYARWQATNYENWLAGVADSALGYNPYLDLVPPLVCAGLSSTDADSGWPPAVR